MHNKAQRVVLVNLGDSPIRLRIIVPDHVDRRGYLFTGEYLTSIVKEEFVEVYKARKLLQHPRASLEAAVERRLNKDLGFTGGTERWTGRVSVDVETVELQKHVDVAPLWEASEVAYLNFMLLVRNNTRLLPSGSTHSHMHSL